MQLLFFQELTWICVNWRESLLWISVEFNFYSCPKDHQVTAQWTYKKQVRSTGDPCHFRGIHSRDPWKWQNLWIHTVPRHEHHVPLVAGGGGTAALAVTGAQRLQARRSCRCRWCCNSVITPPAGRERGLARHREYSKPQMPNPWVTRVSCTVFQ